MTCYKSAIRYPYSGKTVIAFLSTKFPYHSTEEWLFLLEKSRVKVQDQIATPDLVLREGDTLTYEPIPGRIKEPEVDTNFVILKETEDFLFVDKPGNLPMHPAGRYRTQTLLNLLEKTYPTVIPVHRLDRETSGIVIFAKSDESRTWLQKKFESREVQKEYLAVVRGFFEKEISLDGFIGKDTNSAVRKKMKFSLEEFLDSKSVSTNFKPLCFNESQNISLVLVRPVTGRIHQIRVSLLYLGYPILGDKLYGPRETMFLDFVQSGLTPALLRELGAERQLLHAHSISYMDDRVSKEVIVKSNPLPEIESLFPNWKDYVP
ncbi:RluA family pseudouridine synthase [Leptospira sp. 2 VSF19]|uniref:Pseudouridine synthase n=1 Tax=Leptospira soteropolitanensis TaxID=2950025 RepID=A0AAW5VJ29_9LEPT|nr:RluA family pseudouridine synthase [Leptospira soteropolitanensis]MCW7492915.1 RluA family pseudouridine synthase [Leptospira soteropolitanensis]MCW7500150.1 RluA family pseudouridine synthase [Leptospira soteropolitanensis]MCW7522401.1 RluA family pseudouridine synthase [Leptospira soteropolitanensis]MCW7526257.1 RluA family pseudouridine synthase [Leptospira soteropolitanensis]MCW7529631.1 RluA family pseudouridine synthase [Leptospira soteropolitanensis]